MEFSLLPDDPLLHILSYLKFTDLTRFVNVGTEPFRSRASSLPGAKVPIGPWPIRCLELSLLGTFERIGRELSFSGTVVIVINANCCSFH